MLFVISYKYEILRGYNMQPFENFVEHYIAPVYHRNNDIMCVDSIGYIETSKPYSFVRRSLDSYVFIYTTNGQAKLCYNNKEYIVNKGDLIFLDCRKLHSYSTYSNYWDFKYLHTNTTKLIEPYYNEITRNGENVVFKYQSFEKECYSKIRKCIIADSDFSASTASINVMILLQNLLSISHSQIPTNISKTAQYIKDNFQSEIKIEDLADMARLSKYHYIRKFSSCYGTTPHDFIVFCRINEAKNLLVTTDDSVENIAYSVGYFSISAFTLSFKKNTGISPSDYKKTMRTKIN